MDRATNVASASDTSYARLRELIVDAHLLPNSHHLEASIATRLGVHDSAVHEAALRLQDDGLVSTEPRYGLWINPLHQNDVLDTFRQASTLEARAAFVAALHSPSSLGMAALDDAILQMKDALFRCDIERWANANEHFHQSLVQCSQHTGLIAATRTLSEALHRARMLSLRLGPLPTKATENHARVVRAIRRGLAADARDSHLDHWRSAGVQMTQIIEQNHLGRRPA